MFVWMRICGQGIPTKATKIGSSRKMIISHYLNTIFVCTFISEYSNGNLWSLHSLHRLLP